MGITGFLPFVDGAKRRVHLSEFSGKRIAVDSYVWLHRGARCCATELAMGIPTDKFTNYAMDMIRMFRAHNVEPVLVFDGGYFPCKAPTESRRAAERASKLASARYLQATRASPQEISDAFYKAVDVTPEMARVLQLLLRAIGVKFYVAPFEADAQLAYLCLAGDVDAVCTIDSDILVYQCPRVLYKLDINTAEGDYFEFDELQHLTDGSRRLFEPWALWRESLFTDMCVLAGCDYVSHPHKVSIKGAQQLCAHFQNTEHVLSKLQMEGRLGSSRAESEAYVRLFRTAQLIFSYAPVYDPITKQLRRLCSKLPPEGSEMLERLNREVPIPSWPPEVVRGVCATGELNPITLEPFEPPGPPAAETVAGPLAHLQRDHASADDAAAARIVRKRPLEVWAGKLARTAAFASTAAARADFKPVFGSGGHEAPCVQQLGAPGAGVDAVKTLLQTSRTNKENEHTL